MSTILAYYHSKYPYPSCCIYINYVSYLLQIEKSRIPPVRVIGVIRVSEKPSIFVPANEPSSGQWFYVDVPMIARTCGLPENTFYIEDINEDVSPANPYPVPKDVSTLIRHSVMPEDHLRYTFTWYKHLTSSSCLSAIGFHPVLVLFLGCCY